MTWNNIMQLINFLTALIGLVSKLCDNKTWSVFKKKSKRSEQSHATDDEKLLGDETVT